MIMRRYLLTAVLIVLPIFTGTTASAQTCQPGIQLALAGSHGRTYLSFANTIGLYANNLTTLLGAVTDEATYQTLLNLANTIAGMTANGRVVITLPDGTVVLDTARNDGPGDPTNNTYQNFQNKTINENHNSRVAIFAAQQYPCGIGVETKTSTSTGQVESYVAIRLGTHLDSQGTAGLSSSQ